MATPDKTNIPLVFGAMTFGEEGTEGARTFTPAEQSAILDLFQAHGQNEVDTARIYANGTSEQHLGALQPSWQTRGLLMDTKLFPRASGISDEANDFTAAGIRLGLSRSLAALRADGVRTFYLHAPARDVPLEETLRAVHELHAEGRFARFGLSNFRADEVEAVVALCRRNGWTPPAVYEGVYSALQRAVEPELLPVLRRHGIALYAFAPLAGGVLTGRYTRGQTEFEAGGRYDPNRVQGAAHHGRYFNDRYFDALDVIRPVAEKHGLTIAECALRWIQHHSQLRRELGDRVIIGASRIQQLESNLLDMEKGPLPQEVVDAIEAGWKIVSSVQHAYWL